MKLPLQRRSVTTLIVIPSVIVVVALGVQQYLWSTRISEATAVRLADSLQMSLMNWQKDFFRYFSEIALALRIDPVEDAPGDVNQYIRRLAEWRALAKYPNLISGVYLLGTGNAAQRLNPGGRFEAQPWPTRFAPFRDDLEKAAVAVKKQQADPQGTPASFGVEDPSAGWLFDSSIPAMFHTVSLKDSASRESQWLAIELNQQEIESRILGQLSQTYFQGTNGLDYEIAVVSGPTRPRRIMYTSDKGFGAPEPVDADGVIDIFGHPYDHASGKPVHIFHAPSMDKGPSDLARISWFPLLRETSENADWRMVVRHRRGGPLGAFVNEVHRRDLAIGFGALLVLAINMAMLIITSHRAQRLAQLQMNFVTAVSHELRTPLTVIISGAENICNGVVGTTQQMTQYGSLIGSQARQLYALVERILQFAATRQGRQHYDFAALHVEELIDSAITSAAELIESRSFTVERDIAKGLPLVSGDRTALSQCLQNLITNALKYGAAQRWIGVCAVALDSEVQISIADRGLGISVDDLPNVFEPFFRSPAVQAAQIHGTGLGLALSQSIAEDMKGRITVASKLGAGSTFTLHLRIVQAGSQS